MNFIFLDVFCLVFFCGDLCLLPEIENKKNFLQKQLLRLAMDKQCAIAFSGGLDSRFLAHMAKLVGLKPLLLHAQGPHVPPKESLFAQQWAQENRLCFVPLVINPLKVPEVAANGRHRCYHCKQLLFSQFLEQAHGLVLFDGTHASDLHTYRPGMVALKELGILSPLADAGLTKAEIRSFAVATGMSFPKQAARPCLLTRFAYDLRPDVQSLEALAVAEEQIEAALQHWAQSKAIEMPDFRLRVLSGGLELHLTPFKTQKTKISFPNTLQRDLKILVQAITGKPLTSIHIMSCLSGFFDNKEGNSQ